MSEHNFSAMRAAMVSSQLRTNNVNDPRITAAMDVIPREQFVPAERIALAYVDVPIPLGNGRALNAPMTSARLLTEAQLKPTDNVLLIGAATGYLAVVLAELVAHVTALEEDAALLDAAKANIGKNAQITVVSGALNAGWASRAAYDVIVIDGAVQHVGNAIVAQLTDGGRLVTGLIEQGITRLAVGWKSSGGFALIPFVDVESVELPGFSHPKQFVF